MIFCVCRERTHQLSCQLLLYGQQTLAMGAELVCNEWGAPATACASLRFMARKGACILDQRDQGLVTLSSTITTASSAVQRSHQCVPQHCSSDDDLSQRMRGCCWWFNVCAHATCAATCSTTVLSNSFPDSAPVCVSSTDVLHVCVEVT